MASSSATTSNNTVATVNIPRVRFFSAVLFLASSIIYALSRIISGIELSGLYRTAMFSAIFTELLTLRMFLPVREKYSIIYVVHHHVGVRFYS